MKSAIVFLLSICSHFAFANVPRTHYLLNWDWKCDGKGQGSVKFEVIGDSYFVIDAYGAHGTFRLLKHNSGKLFLKLDFATDSFASYVGVQQSDGTFKGNMAGIGETGCFTTREVSSTSEKSGEVVPIHDEEVGPAGERYSED